MNPSKDKFSHIIRKQTETKNISHAYLVFGEFNPATFVEIYKIKNPDIFQVFENPIKINHIRELIHWLSLKPHSSSLKLTILYGIENMTIEAANSLLKVLEEPPAYAVLVLQAFKKERIPPTILSRCQIIYEIKRLEKNIPQNYLSSKKISQMPIKERFDYASKIADDDNVIKFINLWEEELRLELLCGKDVRGVLKSLFQNRHLLLTNTSVKFLLENLLLKF